MDNPEEIAKKDIEFEAQIDRYLKRDIVGLKALVRNIDTDLKHLEEIEKIVDMCIKKKEHKNKKFQIQLLKIDSLLSGNKINENAANKKKERIILKRDKIWNKITKNNFHKISVLLSGTHMATISKNIEEIDERINEEIKRVMQAESQESKALSRIKEYYHKIKGHVNTGMGQLKTKVGNMDLGKGLKPGLGFS